MYNEPKTEEVLAKVYEEFRKMDESEFERGFKELYDDRFNKERALGKKRFMLTVYAACKLKLEKGESDIRSKLRLIELCGSFGSDWSEASVSAPDYKPYYEELIEMAYNKCRELYIEPLYLSENISSIENAYLDILEARGELTPAVVERRKKLDAEKEFAENYIAENLIDSCEKELSDTELAKKPDEDWETCSKRRADHAIRVFALAEGSYSKNDDIPKKFCYIQRIAHVNREMPNVEKFYPEYVDSILEAIKKAYGIYKSFAMIPKQYRREAEGFERELLKHDTSFLIRDPERKKPETDAARASLGSLHPVTSDIIDGYFSATTYGREVFAALIATDCCDEGIVFAECERLFDGAEFRNEHEYRAQPNRTHLDRIELNTGGRYDDEDNYISFLAGIKYRYLQREGTDD